MTLRRWLVVSAATAFLIVAAAIGLARIADAPTDPAETPAHDIRATPEMIARGAYLVRAGDCSGCHSVPGGQPFAGGLAMAMPFGTIHTSNITPDPVHGIGRWSDADFLAAMYRGISRDGHHLYPAFPYTNFTRMPVADILAIKAFLFAQKPVPEAPPENRIAFPFNQRWGIAYWNLLFNPKQRFTPDPAKSAEVNRGTYLVEGPGHCGGCHSPRTLLYAESSKRALGGGVAEEMRAFNISSDRQWGIGAWSDEALVSYMRDGYARGHGAAGASMGLVVQESLSHLDDADLRAIVAYLRQTKPVEGTVAIAARPVGATQGALLSAGLDPRGRRLYAGACAGCHGWGGALAAAPLAGRRTVNDPEGLNVTAAILRGIDVRTPHGRVHMPAFGSTYSDAEVAALTRYVVAAFGSKAAAVDSADIARARHP